MSKIPYKKHNAIFFKSPGSKDIKTGTVKYINTQIQLDEVPEISNICMLYVGTAGGLRVSKNEIPSVTRFELRSDLILGKTEEKPDWPLINQKFAQFSLGLVQV